MPFLTRNRLQRRLGSNVIPEQILPDQLKALIRNAVRARRQSLLPFYFPACIFSREAEMPGNRRAANSLSLAYHGPLANSVSPGIGTVSASTQA